MHFFADELSGLCARSFSSTLVLASALQRFFLRHYESSRKLRHATPVPQHSGCKASHSQAVRMRYADYAAWSDRSSERSARFRCIRHVPRSVQLPLLGLSVCALASLLRPSLCPSLCVSLRSLCVLRENLRWRATCCVCRPEYPQLCQTPWSASSYRCGMPPVSLKKPSGASLDRH